MGFADYKWVKRFQRIPKELSSEAPLFQKKSPHPEAEHEESLGNFLSRFIAEKEGVKPEDVTLDYIRERRKERTTRVGSKTRGLE